MTCAFCGLETGHASSHETQEACIEALRSQVSELRHVLEHSRRTDEPLEVTSHSTVAVYESNTRR